VKKISLLILLIIVIIKVFSQTISINSLQKSQYCQGDSSLISFEVTGLFNSDNSFKIELCLFDGTSYQTPIYIGEKASSNIGKDSISFLIPSNIQSTNTYSYRIVSSSPIIESNIIYNLSVFPKPKINLKNLDSVYCLTENPSTFTSSTNELKFEFSGIGISNNTFTPKDAGEGYHYFICKTTNKNNCISIDSTRIKVIKTLKPIIPFNDTICASNTLNIKATGDSITWFADSALTKILYFGENIQYLITDTLNHSIYTTQTQNNCKSEAEKISFSYKPKTINSTCLAKTPSLYSSSTALCEGSKIDYSIIAHYNGVSTIRWFDGSNYTVANTISKDSILHFEKNNSSGIWIYYAYEYDSINKCYSSTAAEYTFIVHSKPKPTMIVPDTSCFAVKSYSIAIQPQGGVLFGPGIEGNELHPEASYLKNVYDTISYTYSDSYGCIGEIKKATFIHFVNLPTLSDKTGYLDSLPQLYAFGDNFTNVVSWYSDITKPAINTGNYYTPEINSTGIYTYFVSQKEKGCSSDLVPLVLNINPRTNSSLLDFEQQKIYPNPAKEYISIPEINTGEAYIYSLDGIEMLHELFYNDKITIKDIPAGMYILKVFANEKLFTQKFIKQ